MSPLIPMVVESDGRYERSFDTLPNAKVMIHQGSAGFRGTPADIEIHAQEVLAMTRRMAEILAKHTGQPFEKVMSDIDRDRFMTPSEALEYGLLDEIVVATNGARPP